MNARARTDTELEAKLRARAWAFWREPGLFAAPEGHVQHSLPHVGQGLDINDLRGLDCGSQQSAISGQQSAGRTDS
jgi:hypothetical protein